MGNYNYPELFNNEHLNSANDIKDSTKISVTIQGSLTTPEKAKKTEDMEVELMGWYKRWKYEVFIQKKEYYEGYTYMDLICSMEAFCYLPHGLECTSEWSGKNDYDLSNERLARIEHLRNNPPAGASFQYDKEDLLDIFERQCLKEPGRVDSPVKLSLSITEYTEDPGGQYIEDLYVDQICTWGKKWKDHIYTNNLDFTNGYVSLDVICSKKAEHDAPSDTLCSTDWAH